MPPFRALGELQQILTQLGDDEQVSNRPRKKLREEGLKILTDMQQSFQETEQLNRSREELIEELKQSKEELKQSKEELKQSKEELKQSKKDEKKFLEKEIRLLCVELSHVKALYATRPLLELGLTRYQTKHQLSASSWTRLSHEFLEHAIFQDSKLQPWVKKRLNKLNKIFEWNIKGEDELFLLRLWNLYHNFSQKSTTV